MILGVFTVYDKAVQAYLQPFFCRTKGEAIRSFTETANDFKSNIGRHAADYYLVFLGEYDDVSGLLKPLADPQRIVSALEVQDGEVVLARTGGQSVSQNGAGASRAS